MILWFHQAQLLILSLAPLAPFGRDIDPFILFTITLGLVLVDRCRLVLRRGVDGVQDQGRGAGVDELMLGSRGDDDQISSFDVLVHPIDGRFPSTRRESQDLVDGVFLKTETWLDSTAIERPEARRGTGAGYKAYLIANFPVHGHSHQDQLTVQARPQNSSEVAGLTGERGRHVGEIGHLMFGRILGGRRPLHRGGCECSKWDRCSAGLKWRFLQSGGEWTSCTDGPCCAQNAVDSRGRMFPSL